MLKFFERLKAERERLALSQQALASRCSVTAKSLRNYETGERFPDVAYLEALANIGADVLYILTGRHGGVLSADEQELLALFRAAPLSVKAAAIGALQGGGAAAQVAGSHNIVARRDMTIHQAGRAR